jgi:gas vesicle protein
MKTLNIVLGLAVTAGVILLLTTDKGEEIREDISDNLKKLSKKVDELAGQASHGVKDLQKMVSKEIHGVSDEARQRIADVLDETSDAAQKAKKNTNRMMA